MTLVIVEKGKKADSQKWAGSCRNCGAKAEALRSDMKNITSDFREGVEFSWEFCPECKTGSPTMCTGLLMYPVK
jgi:hypothetical protein